MRELNFLSYERALRETMPALEEEDTDINLVIAHVCQDPLEQLIYRTQDLDIALFGAGHCNEQIARQVQDTVLLGGGFHFTAYATATFSIDLTTSEVRISSTARATMSNQLPTGQSHPSCQAGQNKPKPYSQKK